MNHPIRGRKMVKSSTITLPELRVATRHKGYVPKTTQKMGDNGEDVSRLQQYLTQFGYFQSHQRGHFGLDASPIKGATPGEFDPPTELAVKAFQHFNGLPVTGALDESTKDLMEQPRCGFPDFSEFTLQGSKWNKTNLTYKFGVLTPDLPSNDVKAAIRVAFSLWAEVTPLRFTETNANADIVIRFGAGDHDCMASFDGAGGVLAHAFYPQGGAIAGDMHFDEAETWSVGSSPGVDLITVAAHELGHALGLAHSTVPGALMAAYYNGKHRSLEADDIAGIQSLYGAA